MKAQICPVCRGSGKYKDSKNVEQICHGCNGKGWILVPDNPKIRHIKPHDPWYPTHKPTITYHEMWWA